MTIGNINGNRMANATNATNKSKIRLNKKYTLFQLKMSGHIKFPGAVLSFNI